MKIKYKDMLENNNIKYKTDTIGFFVTTIKIPEIRDITVKIYKTVTLYPEKILNVSNKIYIKKMFLILSLTNL
jgi:hypothetical protein